MMQRKLERLGLWILGITIVLIPIGLYFDVLSLWFLLIWCFEWIIAPVCIAAYNGWNPHARPGQQQHCLKHKYTYYVSFGCDYCVKDNG